MIGNALTVYDNTTGRYWQRTAGPVTNFMGAINYCASLVYDANNNWRAPTVSELAALVDTSMYPTIDACAFPNNTIDSLWTGTGYGPGPLYSSAYAVFFSSGATWPAAVGSNFSVRCVR